MTIAQPMCYNVTAHQLFSRCYPGCTPDSDCYPCDPCGPDTVCNPRGSSDEEMGCYPCSPCNPDASCYPCSPCNPDARCYPCSPCNPDALCYPDNTGDCNPDVSCPPDDSDDDGGSGCFLTSACVCAMGLTDDCEELQLMRALRDKRKLYDNAFIDLIKEYYVIAPQIVSAINKRSDSATVYHDIYNSLVRPCVDAIKQNNEREAIALYIDKVLMLKNQYLEVL